jgi:hypothetical protein
MSRMVYEWAEGAPFSSKVKARVAGEALEEIRRKSGGVLLPKAVVAASKAKDAPLHRCFEWDNDRAGTLYREDQARNLIRSVRVLEATGPRSKRQDSMRAYVHVDTGHERAYVTTAEALSDPKLREQVLRRAVAELRGWQARYDGLKELSRIYTEIERVETKIEGASQKKAA